MEKYKVQISQFTDYKAQWTSAQVPIKHIAPTKLNHKVVLIFEERCDDTRNFGHQYHPQPYQQISNCIVHLSFLCGTLRNS